MNSKILILFVILLLGLILCSFLGGKGCVEGFDNITAVENTDGSITIVADGNTIKLTKNADGSYTGPNGYSAKMDSNGNLTLTSPDDTTTTTAVSTTTAATDSSATTDSSSSSSSSSSDDLSYTDPYSSSSNTYDDYNHYTGASSTVYKGPNGTATIIDNGSQGKQIIVVINGQTQTYTISGADATTYTGPNGGTATVVKDGNGNAAVKITANGTSTLYTVNYNGNPSVDSTMNQYNSNTNTSSTGSDYNNAYVYTGPNGNTAAAVTGPNGNTYVGTNYDSSAYYNSLPPGISANQIPSGQEDLYILKSQVVPPVCPKCPDPIVRSSDDSDTSKCPPCPPCARCPEPAFDCKKVPNYNAFNPSYMPMPVLSDFSSFGM